MISTPHDDPFAEPPRARSAWRWLPLIVGLVVFEATQNAMLGVALACFRFGEKDFATAWWLRSRDPDRARGRACGWFHLAWGFAKIGLISFLAIGLSAALILTIDAIFRFKAIGLLAQIQGAMITALGAIAAFLLTSYVAIAMAGIGGVRVWASVTNHWSREARRWPPVPEVAPKPESNRAMPVVALSGTLTLLTLLLGGSFVVTRIWAGKVQAQAYLNVVAVVMMAGMIGNLWLLARLSTRLPARGPAECWPEA